MKKFPFPAAAAALFLAVPLAACGGGGAEGEDKHEEGESHAEGEGEEDAKGPNGGKLLKNGDFAVEVTIFENGTEPQFRVFATRGGKPVDPKDVQLAITLTRLGGDVDRFTFRPQGKFLAGQGVVTEPHSFDVEVVAVTGGKRHVWKYANPEGRTRIATDAAKAGGIETAVVGPATVGEMRELYTRQQLHVMKQERPNWTRFSDRPVTLSAQPTSLWEPAEQIVVMCPIIAWTKDRARVLIIAPAGDKIWIAAQPETKKGRTP